MSSGAGPYVLNSPSDTSPAPNVLETVITAEMLAGQDIGLDGGRLANIEAYNGAIPGPLFKLNKDDTVIVRLINKLDHPTGIHWHGIELANSADGTELTQEAAQPAPMPPPPPPVPPGGTYLYKFRVPRPGLFWYHPHHHLATNRVFRGLYGMIVVQDPNEAALIAAGTIPADADTKQLVLSDITVCKAAPGNDLATYTDPTTVVPAGDAAEWMSGNTAQASPTPKDLCEIAPAGHATNDDGTVAGVNYNGADVPSILQTGLGRVNEGQTVLTNGYYVGGRAGTPGAPGALAPGAHTLDVLSGQGLRLQIGNCATMRYFRLILTTEAGVQVPLVRIGGEGGLLDHAVVEGGVVSGFDWLYDPGEILIPPGSRVDLVAAIPAGLPVGSKLTLWTRDYPRLGGGPSGFADLPTVPVMHLNVTGNTGSAFAIADGTPLRTAVGSSVETLGPATGSLLNSAAFVPPKPGSANQTIVMTTSGGPSIDGVHGHFEGFSPYGSAPHIGSSRYAEAGRILQLQVTNAPWNNANHPFHLHGFSFQPVSLTRAGFPTYTWPYPEFRDNIDMPTDYTLTFRVRLDDRPLVDGVTMGGALGRWLFHCHIFFHHHQGMIGELVVCAGDGKERPNVDVNGSWAYVPSGGIAQRQGRYYSLDGSPVTLSASVGTVTATGPGSWSWTYDTAGVPDGTQYVYITGQDSGGRKGQAVFRLKIGAPDDGADNGDPHIRTVDGTYYDFQAAGEFTLLRDAEGLEIQVRQTPVPSATPIADPYTGLTCCVSVNTAVAARIGGHRIAFQPSRRGEGRLQFFLDGKPAELSEQGYDFDHARVVAYAAGGVSGLRIDYADHTTLIATPWFWSSYNIWILNVSVTHTGADQGLMGRIPNNSWLPMLPHGGNLGPRPAKLAERYDALYRTFADAWRVTDSTSLFVYEPGTSTKTFTDRNWPPGKGKCTPAPGFELPGAKPPLTAIKPQVARRLCKPVRLDDLNRGCVFDVATTGDKELVKNYLLAQEIRLTGTSVRIVADPPVSQPGEPVALTALVKPLSAEGKIPAGQVTFLVDDVPAGKPLDLDRLGRTTFRTASLSRGIRRVRAVFTSDDERARGSSSPTLRHPVERKPAADRSEAPYSFSGLFYEACDCFTICPCWLGENPDEGACTGMFAWEIQQGSIDGVDVSGLLAVSVSQHAGARQEARQRVVVFIDERATRRQGDVLAAALTGRLGGPLKELGALLGELLAVERASISLEREGRLTTLIVNQHLRVEGMANEGASGTPTALNEGILSTVLGTPAEVGQSGRFKIGLDDHQMRIDVRGRSTMSGRFSYAHAPAVGGAQMTHGGSPM